MHRPDSFTYQLILETDRTTANKMLSQGSVLIGFNQCKIQNYRPVLRCGNFQLYGHINNRCERATICTLCAQGHSTSSYPHKEDSSQHRCINCYHRENYFRHTAHSSTCPVFRFHLQKRNLHLVTAIQVIVVNCKFCYWNCTKTKHYKA